MDAHNLSIIIDEESTTGPDNKFIDQAYYAESLYEDESVARQYVVSCAIAWHACNRGGLLSLDCTLTRSNVGCVTLVDEFVTDSHTDREKDTMMQSFLKSAKSFVTRGKTKSEQHFVSALLSSVESKLDQRPGSSLSIVVLRGKSNVHVIIGGVHAVIEADFDD